MVNQEDINLKLKLEMTEIKQEISKKKKKTKEDEQKNSTNGWTIFSSSLMLCVITGIATQHSKILWILFAICALILITGLYLGISSSDKVKKINKEIEKLEKKKKELRNSIR